MLYFEVEGETTQIWWALTHFFYFPLWSRAVDQDTEGLIRGNCAERHPSDTCSNAEADPVQALRGDVPNEQGYSVHRRMRHPRANAHEGTRLLKSMKNGESVAMWPWEGVGLGRCWLARLGTGPAGATVFQLQPKQRLLNDGFSCDDDKPDGRSGAKQRRVYTNRERAAAIEKLRRFQKQPRAIFEAYRMTPLQYASKTVGTAESNISKWAKDEDNIVEVAANKITGGLMKRNRSKPWFPRAESELHKLFRAKRKRGLKVSTLWLCVTMGGLVKQLYPDDPRAGTFTPSWRFMGKWAKKWERRHKAEEQLEESEHRGAPPQDPALPQVAAVTHAEPGTGVSSVERGRCGEGQWRCIARCRRV